MTFAVLMGIGAVAALGFGIYLGSARKYDQPLDDIDERLGTVNKRQSARKHFTWLGMLQKKSERGSKRRRRGGTRRPFKM